VIAFEISTHINRPIEEVFAYVSEPLNLPRWNSAVQAVRKTSADGAGAGSTYLMERDLPTGRAVNELEVVASKRPREFVIRATAGPTPFLYRYRFSVVNGATVMQLEAEVELPRPASPAGARPARGQAGRRCQPGDTKTDPRSDGWLIAHQRRPLRVNVAASSPAGLRVRRTWRLHGARQATFL
jgi:uncharacterized protein YndB with AHSA1/START domain